MTAPVEPGDESNESLGPVARRPGRQTGSPPVRGRWTIAAVAVVIAAVALAQSLLPSAPAVSAPASNDGVGIAPADSYSSSLFCVTGAGTTAATTIYLTNATTRMVVGTMTTVGEASAGGTARTVQKHVSVPPRGTLAVDPATGLPAGGTATSVTLDGGGVVGSQVVNGANGWSTTPCASMVSPHWAFAGGSTTTGNTLSLTLFNPTASDAVVNVSFLTPAGVVAPQDYQGITVPAGRLVADNVGDFVQDASGIITLVTAESGAVTSSEFQQWSSGATGGLSARLGAPGLSTVWRFAQTTAMPGSTVDFVLGNPGSAPATATVALGLASGTVVPRRVVVAPETSMTLPVSGTSGLPQQAPYSVTITSTAPIVVGRSVRAGSGTAPPVWGSSSGTAALASHWLVAAPGSPSVPGWAGATVESLAVANPGRTAARVTVSRLTDSGSGVGPGRPGPAMTFTVPAHELTVLGTDQVGGLRPLVVRSSRPVNVEENSGPAAAGIVTSTGFPFAD